MYSVGSEHRICMECAEVLWTKRAYHKDGRFVNPTGENFWESTHKV